MTTLKNPEMYLPYSMDIFCMFPTYMLEHVHNLHLTKQAISTTFTMSDEAFTCETIVMMIESVSQILNLNSGSWVTGRTGNFLFLGHYVQSFMWKML